MKRAFLLATSVALIAVGCQSGSDPEDAEATPPETTAQAPAAATMALTYSQIETTLAKCTPCHGENPKEALDLRSYEGLMKGSEHGVVVVAGEPDNSMIIHALRGTNGKKQMPMMLPPLSEEEIAQFEAWIKEGAKGAPSTTSN